jgi:hypothetical protein
MAYAEDYASPLTGAMALPFQRSNDFKQSFTLRWGAIRFAVHYGASANIKVLIKIYRATVCEQYLVDTDASELQWNSHQRQTRDFFVMPQCPTLGPAQCIKFSFIVHIGEIALPSRWEYIWRDGGDCHNPNAQQFDINTHHATANSYRGYQLNPQQLQADVDYCNHHFESLNLTPKFTKGQQHHPYHPKRYIHDHIDAVIVSKHQNPTRLCTIKVSVDCIDDQHFINHLIHAHQQGVCVQCIVDWRKMTLTLSDNYRRLKQSGIELIGVFCTPKHHLIEVEPDMHTKFILFNDEDCILGSFNITFDRWWANWESGMTFQSQGVCRMLDNIFQSQRGGVIQGYGIDPLSRFNLLYTFGRQRMANGKLYRPHHAIIAEIHRAQHSIQLCLFLIGELQGDHHDSVITALIQAHQRGVAVHILFNGHLARQGLVGQERTMTEELDRPLLPAIQRLKDAGIRIGLVYGQDNLPVPYSPIHSKYGIIDQHIVIEGSFNWYNTSVYSHDLLVIAANESVAHAYLFEFEQIQRLFRVY